MAKNIVLCSDGTGNKGGTGSDTNVFKIYKAIRINDDTKQQAIFYDNGVGTSKVTVARALGGGLGLGFRYNVRDLYEFLGRHYQEGDDIYVFGFSRGAATVRAFAGMLEHCGLVTLHTGVLDKNNVEIILEEDEFQKKIDDAMEFYMDPSPANKPKIEKNNKNVKIDFLGVWDTVSALGFPQIPWLDKIVNSFRRHFFYDYEPKKCVNNVYHAIAVDDERRTFWPMVWDENSFEGDGVIEQVWFPGVHSNIGGGYPREGLATVTLDWMMERLAGHQETLKAKDPTRGLNLKLIPKTKARRDANPYGKLYDSRSGFALFYRYQPRPIQQFADKLKNSGPIKIHESVFNRMRQRTADYAPVQLPETFDVVGTREKDKTPLIRSPKRLGPHKVTDEETKNAQERINKYKNIRIFLYWVFFSSSLLFLSACFYLWKFPCPGVVDDEVWRAASGFNCFLGHVADILRYFLPKYFMNAIDYGVINNPGWLGGLVVFVILMMVMRGNIRKKMDDAQEEMRKLILKNLPLPG